jgi:hypothetical protein
MDTNLTRNEALSEDGHTYNSTDAKADLTKIHNVFRDTLAALTKSCITNHVLLSEHEIGVALEGVGEALSNEADRPLEHLLNESYTPADAGKLIAKAHTAIVDGLRIQPIDWSGVFETMFRPQPTRGTAPQNPATLAAKGQL